MIETSQTGECHWIKPYITSIPNFPKEGITFQSYYSLLQDPQAFRNVVHALAERYRILQPDRIACIDARGFIFGTALAYELQIPFFLVRKVGKLPNKSERIDYSLQYANASMEIECNAIKKGERILVIDDVLATGGTAEAACKLIGKLGGTAIEFACIIELLECSGRKNISTNTYSLIAI